LNPLSTFLAALCILSYGTGLSAIAEPEPTKVYEVWRQDERAPNFKVRAGFDEADLKLRSYVSADAAAWAMLETALNETAARLATGGFLSGKQLNGASIPIQPVSPSADGPLSVVLLSFGLVIPPDELAQVANVPVADVKWVRNLTSRKTPPQLQTNSYRDPIVLAASAVAGQAISRMAFNGDNITAKTWDFDASVRGTDPAGRAIMASGMVSLTGFATDGMVDAHYESGPARLGFLHYARQYDRVYPGGEQGVNAVKLLGIGSSWQKSWSGIDDDSASGGASRTAMSGMLNAVMANGGPAAMKAVFERKWPKAGRGDPSVTEWIRWLDEGIKLSGNTPGAWRGQTPFVAERGLAGAYVTSLSDILAMPARFRREAPNESLPEGFATLYHLESLFSQPACQTVDFNLAAGVTDIDISLAELTAQCVRVRWTGPDFGRDHARPPIAISAYGAGLDYTDLDALLLSSAGGERVGLSVSDSESGKTVKTWMVDYVADFDGDDAMTLAFANVAADAAATRPLSIRLTVGTGITAGRGDLVAQVNKAPPNTPCSAGAVPMPPLADSVPYPAIASFVLGLESGAGGSGDFGDLLGFATEPFSEQQTGELPMRFCTAPLRWNLQKDALSALFNGRGPGSTACLPDMADATRVYTSRKKRPSFRRFDLNLAKGADTSGNVIPIRASVTWNDPSLPVFPMPRAMGPDDRTDDPKAEMEGFLTFQIRTETRLRGRIDLVVPPQASKGESTCGASPAGTITTMFDLVSALPDARQARLVGPDALAAVSPDVWTVMPAAKRAEYIARVNRERSGGGRKTPQTSRPGEAEACLCTCAQYSDPAAAALCSPSCAKKLENSCKAGPVTQAEKACFVKLSTELLAPFVRDSAARQLRNSLEGVDPEMLKAMVREQIEELKAEGRTCD